MSSKPSTSKQDVVLFEDDEIFEDSSVLANLENSSFRDISARFFESNLNDSSNKSTLNVSALCCDEELSGFDKLTGATWIYPTNYPVRDYQFNIINAAILKNTLVSLPTGLGKTFIAAVIMYNFYRWYPLGKIIFTAPTRPLVAQQIEACYNIVALPPNDTVEMTGHMQQTTRKTHWQSKRVFFATPQVIYNDIKSGVCPAEKIRCLVIDEAHRARGNYAYCQIVGTLTDMGHKLYRMLALSATPGSKVEDVINVIRNLHIAHLELRSEGCVDVAPYSHTRRIQTEIIQLGPELTTLRQRYVEILDGYARNLKDMNILPHNLGNLSKGRVVMMYKEFQNKERTVRHPRHNYIIKDFMILIALFHGLELLTKHGARVFLNFFDEHPEKVWIQADDRLTSLLERLRDDLGMNPLSLNTSILPDGTIPEIPKDIRYGHPKFERLKEIMLNHFKTAKEKGQDTRAIVFCEYRESVNLVHCLLLQCRPLIRPQMFVGQGASGKDGKTVVSQKQQLRVMRNFREGGCNALVATCVAEEGLDVGSVDLIVCFDISTRSPIRLVQRCGRTGRERGGQVYILVTEGREHQTLMECMKQRDGLNKKILQSREVQSSLYTANPRMLPRDLTPKCQKMFITVAKKDEKKTADNAKKGQKTLRNMLFGRASSSGFNREIEYSDLITEQEFKSLFPDGFRDTHYFEEPKELWAMNKEKFKNLSTKIDPHPYLKLSTWLEWQRTLQKTVNVGHSMDSEILASLLQYSDAKRFDLPPLTQNIAVPSFSTQDFASQNVAVPSPVKDKTPMKVNTPAKPKQIKKKQKFPLVKSPGKKDGDIRALFSTATKSTKNYTKFINDLGIKDDGTIPTRLLNLLVDLGVESNRSKHEICYVCQVICDCSVLKNIRKEKSYITRSSLQFIKDEKPKFPDLDLIDEFDAESILRCEIKMEASLDLMEIDFKEVSHVSNVDEKNNRSGNFDLQFDFDSPIDIISPENNVKNNEKPNDSKENDIQDNNFDIGDIEDIFADSSPAEDLAIDMPAVEAKEKDSSDPKEALGFFGLNSIDDIFADSDESNITNISCKTPRKTELKKTEEKLYYIPSNEEHPGSPSILSGRCTADVPTSPILCSQIRKFKLSTKKREPQSSTPVNRSTKRKLIEDVTSNKSVLTPGDKVESNMQTSLVDTSNKSMFTITQLVDMINKSNQDVSDINNSKIAKQVDDKVSNEDDRSPSPILLTQAERKKLSINVSKTVTPDTAKRKSDENKKTTSLIILESDSDSEDNTQEYDIDEINAAATASKLNISEPLTQLECYTDEIDTQDFFNEIYPANSPNQASVKRKLDTSSDSIINSPFFSKKQKLNNNNSKPLSLQDKVLAALSCNKMKSDFFNNDGDKSVNFMLSQVKNSGQKENEEPKINGCIDNDKKTVDEDYVRRKNLEMLQSFRRDIKINSPKLSLRSLVDSQKITGKARNRKINSDDSDDDFVTESNDRKRTKSEQANSRVNKQTLTNHKIRKKKSKNEFLDDEAELSDGSHDSGDEMSDGSIGSIIDFICDDNQVTHHEDMQAHYMRSVKSPVQGIFKIPQLPKKYDNADVFSQYVEEDNYEMDSFCVDSHIGLTQVNEISELEAAEMLLERRKAKKKTKRCVSPDETCSSPVTELCDDSKLDSHQNNDESPLVRRKKKNIKNRIQSDSEDSS